MLGLDDVAGATTNLMTGGGWPRSKGAARLPEESPMTDHSTTVTGQSLSAWRPDGFGCGSADTVGQPLRALAVPRARIVISFDIDGTMEFGDPPGPVSASIARELVDRGCILGVASDWAMSCQAPEWARHGIAPRFVGGKHPRHQITNLDYYWRF